MRELAVPLVDDVGNPMEMARIWVTTENGRSHVSLHYGMYEDHELEVWGSLAADLIAHAVRACMMDGSTVTSDEAFSLIEKGLRARLSDNPTLNGTFSDRVLS
jgi:hypothetical protein